MPYTYILEISDGKSYIGYRSNHKKSPQEDISYNGSCRSLNKAIKNGEVTVLNKIILDVYDTAEEAIKGEIILHNLFNVGESPLYWNKSKQTSSGFSMACTKPSEETRAKMSTTHKKRYSDPEERAKTSEAGKKRYSNSEERAKTSEAGKKAMSNPETRAKISEAGKKRFSDPEERAKISVANKGKIRSNEAKIRYSEAAKKREATKKLIAATAQCQQLL